MKAKKIFLVIALMALLIPFGSAAQETNPRDSKSRSSLIYPFVDCVEHLDNGDMIAHFGYVNTTFRRHRINANGTGSYKNKLTGTGVSFNEGQPEVFYPGTHHNAFSVTFGNGKGKGTVNWHLGLEIAQAHWKHSDACEPVQEEPTEKITPVLECVDHNNDGTYTAHFGYYNANDVEVEILVGDNNKFTGLDSQDGGQVETFLAGRVYDAFTVDFDGSNIVWNLQGPDGQTRTATASDNPAQACTPPEEDDADEDGVDDDEDAYPEDSSMAYDNYWPGQDEYGSLAFEDNWPGRGDYDFNDIVVDYNFHTITDAGNKINRMDATFILKASGAYFHNAFGFEITGIPSDAVVDVEGTYVDELFSISENGTEAGQEWATIIIFDDAFEHMEPQGSGVGVNTEPDAPYVDPVTFDVTIYFRNNDNTFPEGGPVDYGSFNESSFNPFIVADQERGKEIHLADYPPTSKVNEGYLGAGDDDSNPSEDRYYKTANNLPWAINIYQEFDYPKEQVEIIDAHLKFALWAQSEGTEFPDWYEDNPGYRNNENIYYPPE